VFLSRQEEALAEVSHANSLKGVLKQLAAEALIDDSCGDQAVKLPVFHRLFSPFIEPTALFLSETIISHGFLEQQKSSASDEHVSYAESGREWKRRREDEDV